MERLIQSHSNEQRTPISEKDFKILKIILIAAQMHVETLIIMSIAMRLALPFFWTIELIIALVLILQFATKPIWKAFHSGYDVIPSEPHYVSEIENRVHRTVIVKESA